MDHLGREVYLYPFWLERNLKEQDESLPETVYDDFYTRLAIAERLFDWSRDLVRRRSYRVVNGLGIAELEQGLEVYHHRSGILDTVHERWSCLAVMQQKGVFCLLAIYTGLKTFCLRHHIYVCVRVCHSDADGGGGGAIWLTVLKNPNC